MMRVFHKGFMALTGAAILAAALPAVAQDGGKPIYNTPQKSSGNAPYNFNNRRNAPAENPVAIQKRKFAETRARYRAAAETDRQFYMQRSAQIEANLKQARLNRLTQTGNAQGQKPAADGAPAKARANSTAGKKMIYQKPADAKKEPGRMFNLKWR